MYLHSIISSFFYYLSRMPNENGTESLEQAPLQEESLEQLLRQQITERIERVVEPMKQHLASLIEESFTSAREELVQAKQALTKNIETAFDELENTLATERARLFSSINVHPEKILDSESVDTSSLNEEFQNEPIEFLELSFRAISLVRNTGITTVGELIKHKGHELLSGLSAKHRKRQGAPALGDIRVKLARHGLSLKGEHKEEILLEQPLNFFSFSIRVKKVFNRLGLKTMSDLVSLEKNELLAAKGFAEMSLIEVRDILNAYGLHLKGEGKSEGKKT